MLYFYLFVFTYQVCWLLLTNNLHRFAGYGQIQYKKILVTSGICYCLTCLSQCYCIGVVYVSNVDFLELTKQDKVKITVWCICNIAKFQRQSISEQYGNGANAFYSKYLFASSCKVKRLGTKIINEKIFVIREISESTRVQILHISRWLYLCAKLLYLMAISGHKNLVLKLSSIAAVVICIRFCAGW